MIETLRSRLEDPEQLEKLYHSVCQEGQETAFGASLMALRAEYPDNMLLKAWYYRLLTPVKATIPPEVKADSRPTNAVLLIILGFLSTAAIYFLIESSINSAFTGLPAFLVYWAPIIAVCAILFLTGTSGKNRGLSGLMCLGIVALAVYVGLISPAKPNWFQSNYLTLIVIHLPLLAWVAVGVSVAGLRSTPLRRFALLGRSFNIFVTVGLYAIGMGVFTAITNGLFAALSINLPEWFLYLAIAVGAGFVPLIVLNSGYDPHLAPEDQDTQHGLSKVIANLMQWFIPLALLVLIIYLAFIPFNFMRPFHEREVLIIYNVLLFAIIALLIGVGPVRQEDLSPRMNTLLRWGVLVLSLLVVVISVYALSAAVYRTVLGGPTMNRVAILGWNLINIAILALTSYRIARWGEERWVAALHSAFSPGIVAYLAWGLMVVILTPLVF